MTNTLKIASSAGAGIDLLGSAYERVEMDMPAPTINRQTRSGCGMNGSQVISRSIESWKIPLVIYCVGADGNTRFDTRDATLAQLEAAMAFETNETTNVNYDGLPRYLLRTVDNQSPGDVWQIMDYEPSFQRRRDDNKFVTLAVDLICWPGQKFPAGVDLTGLTVTNILGGIGRVIFGGDGFPAHLVGL